MGKRWKRRRDWDGNGGERDAEHIIFGFRLGMEKGQARAENGEKKERVFRV